MPDYEHGRPRRARRGRGRDRDFGDRHGRWTKRAGAVRRVLAEQSQKA